MNKKENIKEKIERFLYEDDSLPATATKFVLMALAIGTIGFAGAVIPGIIRLLDGYPNTKKYPAKKIKSAIQALQRRKFIEIIQEKDDRCKVKLTNKGKERIQKFYFDSLVIPKQKKWDRKWRVVIFDVPNKFNRAREALREKIKELGFYRLQKSVWIYPYPCEDEVLVVAEIFRAGNFIEIMEVNRILREGKLRRYFNL